MSCWFMHVWDSPTFNQEPSHHWNRGYMYIAGTVLSNTCLRDQERSALVIKVKDVFTT